VEDMAKNTEKNRLACNVEARKKHKEKNYKYQSVLFKISELEDINAYCKEHGIPKNTLLRQAAMQRIGKPFV
jgi:hypothetical protein